MFYVLSSELWRPTQFPRKNDVWVVLEMSDTTGVAYGAGVAYPSGAPELTPDFYSVRVTQSSVCSIVSFYFGHGVVCRSIYDFLNAPLVSLTSP